MMRNMNQSACFSVQFEAATIKLLQGKNTSFADDPKTRWIHKSMFPCISELCKDTLGCIVRFHEKRG